MERTESKGKGLKTPEISNMRAVKTLRYFENKQKAVCGCSTPQGKDLARPGVLRTLSFKA